MIISKRMRWAGKVARGRSEIYTQFCSENMYRRGFLEDLIKSNVEEIARVGLNWVHLAQDRDQW
jgi:S-adenosylmethionine:diacylglycerol 3-amino-3-carboxypropyl transferase